MSNEHHDLLSHPAVLENRVSGLETSVKGIKTDVASLATALNQSHERLSTQISNLGQTTAQATAQANTTDWKTLTGFGVLILAVVGGTFSLSKQPVDAAITRAEIDIREIRKDLVPRVELEQRWMNSTKREDRVSAVLNKLRDDLYVARSK